MADDTPTTPGPADSSGAADADTPASGGGSRGSEGAGASGASGGRGNEGCGPITLGCGLIAGMFLFAILGGLVYFLFNYTAITSRAVSHAATQMVEASGLNESEQRRVTLRIEEVKLAWQEGRLPQAEAARAFETLVPLLYVSMIQTLRDEQVPGSNLTEAEQAEAQATLDRLARATYDRQAYRDALPLQQVQQALMPVAATTDEGAFRIAPNPSQENLREMLRRVKSLLDEASVPPAPADRLQVDVAAEAEAVLDDALAAAAP